MVTEAAGPRTAVGPAASPEFMIAVRDLEKRYKSAPQNAVDGVTFAVPRGEVFGLLGPNGAGKTTTIGVLTTRVRPTGGVAEIAGIDVAREPVRAKAHIAVVPQRMNLDRELTARQNLLFHAAYFGIPRAEREQRADRLLEELGLGGRGGDKVDRYSGGMAQRLMIARALMHAPDVLFLDEPTTGVDPQGRLFVWDRIKELHRQGLTILLTTHYMDEAEELCDRVAIMDHGKILALDTPEALRRLVPGASALELDVALPDAGGFAGLLSRLEALPGVERVERVERGAPSGASSAGAGPWAGPPDGGPVSAPAPSGTPLFRLYAERASALAAPAIQAISEVGGELRDLRVARASLEDVFIHLTGRALR